MNGKDSSAAELVKAADALRCRDTGQEKLAILTLAGLKATAELGEEILKLRKELQNQDGGENG